MRSKSLSGERRSTSKNGRLDQRHVFALPALQHRTTVACAQVTLIVGDNVAARLGPIPAAKVMAPNRFVMRADHRGRPPPYCHLWIVARTPPSMAPRYRPTQLVTNEPHAVLHRVT
jgi:hypothetical protein